MQDTRVAHSTDAAVLWQAGIQRAELSGTIPCSIKHSGGIQLKNNNTSTPPDFLLTACFEAVLLICSLAASLSCRRRKTSCCRCCSSLACCSSSCCLASTARCCAPLAILSVRERDLLSLKERVCLLNTSRLRVVSSACILL